MSLAELFVREKDDVQAVFFGRGGERQQMIPTDSTRKLTVELTVKTDDVINVS